VDGLRNVGPGRERCRAALFGSSSPERTEAMMSFLRMCATRDKLVTDPSDPDRTCRDYMECRKSRRPAELR
jgi:hypothetical protein